MSYVEQVVGAGQLHLRTVSKASAFKLYTLGAGQSNLSTCVSVNQEKIEQTQNINLDASGWFFS